MFTQTDEIGLTAVGSWVCTETQVQLIPNYAKHWLPPTRYNWLRKLWVLRLKRGRSHLPSTVWHVFGSCRIVWIRVSKNNSASTLVDIHILDSVYIKTFIWFCALFSGIIFLFYYLILIWNPSLYNRKTCTFPPTLSPTRHDLARMCFNGNNQSILNVAEQTSKVKPAR